MKIYEYSQLISTLYARGSTITTKDSKTGFLFLLSARTLYCFEGQCKQYKSIGTLILDPPSPSDPPIPSTPASLGCLRNAPRIKTVSRI